MFYYRIYGDDKMNEEEYTTTIEIKKETWSRLNDIKKIDESFDDVVNKLLDHYDEDIEQEVDRDWVR